MANTYLQIYLHAVEYDANYLFEWIEEDHTTNMPSLQD
jgi:hypothetical protein